MELRIKNILSIVCCLLLLLSCKKEEQKKQHDPSLVKTWTLIGFYTQEGQEINQPEFDPASLFQYEVNILFFWNEWTEKYEVQGQGPYDLFWGEYESTGKELSLDNFKTTGSHSDIPEVDQYDKLLFMTLKKVSTYSIGGQQLKLHYENGSKYMLFELRANQYHGAVPYMTAAINGLNWNGEYQTSSSVRYNDYHNLYNLSIGGISEQSLTDGYRYTMGISFGFVPFKGEYTFNNDGIVMIAENGVMGICSGRDANSNYIDTRSTTGIVTITGLGRSYIEGYFHFEGEGIGAHPSDPNSITNGKFLVPISSDSEWFKPYVF